jgi:hypothetical protein
MGSIAETLLMGIGKQRTSLEARLADRADAKALAELVAQEVLEALVALAELVVRVAPEALAELVAQEVLEALAELAALVALAEPVVLVGLAELAVRVAVLEPEISEPVIAPVAVLELEIVQVVAQETKHLAAQAAVVLRTKSVTAAHRRGLVLVLAAED